LNAVSPAQYQGLQLLRLDQYWHRDGRVLCYDLPLSQPGLTFSQPPQQN